MPTEVAERLTGVRSGKGLTPVPTIRATRDRYRLQHRHEDSWHAEIADDHVQALSGHRQLMWREIEIHLGPAATSLPFKFVDELEAAGPRPARYPSKLLPPLLPSVHSPGGPDGMGAFADYLHTQRQTPSPTSTPNSVMRRYR